MRQQVPVVNSVAWRYSDNRIKEHEIQIVPFAEAAAGTLTLVTNADTTKKVVMLSMFATFNTAAGTIKFQDSAGTPVALSGVIQMPRLTPHTFPQLAPCTAGKNLVAVTTLGALAGIISYILIDA